MFLCYIDESGTSSIPGNTSHFILAGIAIPVWSWKKHERDITKLKEEFGLASAEIHTAWIMRSYTEQNKIDGFELMSRIERRSAVQQQRKATLLQLQRSNAGKHYKQTKKNFAKTEAYIHLTYDERKRFMNQVAQQVSKWKNVRLFAECIDKVHFDPQKAKKTVDEQAFIQLISRFEQYLQITDKSYGNGNKNFGLLIHDNNYTVSKKHTQLMKDSHERGTLWTKIRNIIETPLFVDSELTSMVQIADLCSYALRRYLENDEETLFNLIYKRADQKNGRTVGIRHFTDPDCSCKICSNH